MSSLFPVNINRFDPYKNYRFVVKFGMTVVAAVSKVTVLKRSSDVIDFKEGQRAIIRKGLGRMKYEPITLERGLTQDRDFETWANSAQMLDSGDPQTFLGDLKRDISIVLNDEAGNPVLGYIVHNCWVSEYQALPELDAGGNAIAIEHIKIEHEGWWRDDTVKESPETSQPQSG